MRKEGDEAGEELLRWNALLLLLLLLLCHRRISVPTSPVGGLNSIILELSQIDHGALRSASREVGCIGILVGEDLDVIGLVGHFSRIFVDQEVECLFLLIVSVDCDSVSRSGKSMISSTNLNRVESERLTHYRPCQD